MALLIRRSSLSALVGLLAIVGLACAEDPRTVSIFAAEYREATRELGLGVKPCRAELEPDVVETAANVTVTVTATGGSSTLDCADGLEVRLDRPLDGRRVVDGATGQAVEVILDR